MTTETTEPLAAWRRIRSGWLLRAYLRPEPALVGVFLVVLGVMALEVGLPLLAGQFITSALDGAPGDVLQALAVGFVVAAFGYSVAKVVQAYLADRLAQNTTNRLRADLTRHCLLLDPSFHHRHRPGELVERIEGDVGALAKFLSTMLVVVLGNVLLLIAILVTLVVVDWRLGLVLTGFVVLICFVLNALRGRATPAWSAALQADAEHSGFVAEQLAATEDLRSSGAVPYALRGFAVRIRDVLTRRVAAIRRTASFERIAELLFNLSLIAGLVVSSWLVLYQGAAVATIYLVYRYADLLRQPIYRINNQIAELQRAAAAVGRIEELFDHQPSIVDGPGAPRRSGAPLLEVSQVDYGYDPDRPVLHDVSFTVAPGSRLGIVGRTGSGKTTIARLLLRLADPDTGAIRLDGHDVRELTVADLRARVGMVTQDVQVMHVSLRDNLTLFDGSVPDERLVDVIEELGLSRLLSTLPHGLDSVLPSGGGGLSAGEAQIISLTRVFLRDPQIVVFDEATSRLDAATERRIDLATERLFAGRTAIVIAHRLATLERMDQILVLDGGRVVEFGDRAQLVDDHESRFAELLEFDRERTAV